MNSNDIHKQHLSSYQKFLDITNKKGALFRDIIIENEYSPFTDKISIKNNIKRIIDPCKRSIQRYNEEELIANNGKTKKNVQLGRNDNLDVKLWSTGIIESTPHGYTNKLISLSSSNTSNSNTLSSSYKDKSNIIFDHYNIPNGYDVLKKEIPKGKKTKFNFHIHGNNSQIHINH